MVVVKEGRATAGGLKKILVAMFAAEDHLHIQPRLFGYVDELNAKRSSCDWRRRAFWRRSCGRFVRLAGVPFWSLGSLLAECRSRKLQNIFER